MHKKADHCVHLHAFVTDLLLIAPMMLGFHYYSLLKHILVFNFFFFFSLYALSDINHTFPD